MAKSGTEANRHCAHIVIQRLLLAINNGNAEVRSLCTVQRSKLSYLFTPASRWPYRTLMRPCKHARIHCQPAPSLTTSET